MANEFERLETVLEGININLTDKAECDILFTGKIDKSNDSCIGDVNSDNYCPPHCWDCGCDNYCGCAYKGK